MSDSICGADCTACPNKNDCGGCAATGGRPFGGVCVVAECCRSKGRQRCADCQTCDTKARLLAEIHALGIADMPQVPDLNLVHGAYINLAYPVNGRTVRLLDDDKIYYANQICKGGGRCYGIAADERYLLVCEYGDLGADPEIVVYKRRSRTV